MCTASKQIRSASEAATSEPGSKMQGLHGKSKKQGSYRLPNKSYWNTKVQNSQGLFCNLLEKEGGFLKQIVSGPKFANRSNTCIQVVEDARLLLTSFWKTRGQNQKRIEICEDKVASFSSRKFPKSKVPKISQEFPSARCSQRQNSQMQGFNNTWTCSEIMMGDHILTCCDYDVLWWDTLWMEDWVSKTL